MLGHPGHCSAVRHAFWARIRAGDVLTQAALSSGVSKGTASRWFREAGGVMPPLTRPARKRPRLTFEQREDIALLHSQKVSYAEIARQVGCHRSTVGRELKLNSTTFKDRHLPKYRASTAQKRADWRARRPGTSKLAGNERLLQEVQDHLEKEHSPEQISNRLRIDFPDDAEMRVSHETIYRELYVEGRGSLRRDLRKRLRTGRAVRKPRRAEGERRGKIPGMISIADRPQEVEGRDVPGHWEGDLVCGQANRSALGTLVERTTGFLLLLHLPDNHGADAVEAAIVDTMGQLPDILRKTLTWDQGREMANHVRVAEKADLDVYFCDPHSPWQRGSNENTNGLLRQYFPKGTDLSVYGPDYLAHVAAKLNNRPRKRLNWQTPAEALDQLLSQPPDQAAVASTA